MADKKTGFVYVCSKMAGNNAYTKWHSSDKAANDMPRKERQVLIKGGAGVMSKQLVTPHGVVTKITEEELALVKKHCPGFRRHVKGGFLTILDKDPSPIDIESIANDMSKDKSSQKTPEDIKKKKK